MATDLRFSRFKRTLTATYSREGRSYDIIDMDGRTIGTTGDGSAEADDDVTGTRFIRRNVDRGDEYRFRVRRCVDSARSDCGGDDDWSGWSDWVPVPNLPSLAGKPTITVTDDDLTVAYTARGTAHDELLFQQSDSKTTGFSNYTGGTLSGKKLSDVDRGKWYRVGVRRCTDSEFTDCTDLSEYSDPKEVVGIGVELASRADGKSAIASLTLLTGFNYTLQLQSRAAGGSWPSAGSGATIASSVSSRTYTSLTGGSLIYRARLNACPTDTPSNCTDYDSTAITLTKAPAPSISGITLANQDDLTVVYTVAAWTNGSGDHYDFEIQRAETATGSFADYEDADTPSATPHKFDNVHTGYHYKARGRRCSDAAATICGNWSGYSSAVNVPALGVQAPTNINVSNPSLAAVRATFTPGSSVLYHVFEVGKSDTETGSFVYAGATNVGATSPVTFSSLEAGKWYKVRGKGCDDTDWKRCGGWAYSVGAVRVGAIAATIGSGADGKSVIASLTLFSGFTYSLQLYGSDNNKDWSDEGRLAFTPRVETTGHAYKGLVKEYYRAELSACKPGACVTHRSNTIAISKAPAPSISSVTLANEDDLTVGYTLPTWNYGSGDVLDFKIRRSESATGNFATDYTDADTPPGMPHKFNDVHTGYHYKARARRCSDAALTICGDWSGFSSAVNVPALSELQPPSNIRVSIVSHKEVKASFVKSTRPSQTTHRYVFEVGKSDTRTGTYDYGRAKHIGALSSVSFGSLEADKWYKVRGKRCYDATGKRCGLWTESTTSVETVAPNPKIKVTNAAKLTSFGAGLPKPVNVSADGLDVTKLYKIELRTASTLVLKFAKCDSNSMPDKLPDGRDENVTPASRSSGTVSPQIYGCASGVNPSDNMLIDPPPTDTLTVKLVEGDGIPVRWGGTVDTVEIDVTLESVPKPTGIRVDGDNRGNPSRGRFRVAWSTVTDATSYELRHGEECPDSKMLCADSLRVDSWTEPHIRMNSSPFTVVSDTPRAWYQHLRRVEIRAVRNGVRSQWTTEAFVFPSDKLPTGRVATTPIYGHHSDREYTFRICDDTFPDAAKTDHDDWVAKIMKGARSWENSLNWSLTDQGEDRNYLSVSRDTSNADQSTGRDTCPILSVYGLIADLGPFVPVPGAHVMAFSSHLGLWVVGQGDWNYPYSELRFVSRKALIARCLGILPRVQGCAPVGVGAQSLIALNTVFNVSLPDDIDVLLLKDVTWMDTKEENGTQCTLLEAIVAHEVGHALGVGAGHASGQRLLMNTSVPGDVCGPQPYDVAAMLTNYQTLR